MSEAMPISALFASGPAGAVKSVQRGVSTPSGVSPLVVSISAVDMSKTTVKLLSSGWNNNTAIDARSVRLKSATELEVVGYYTSIQTSATSGLPVSWEVVEFY